MQIKKEKEHINFDQSWNPTETCQNETLMAPELATDCIQRYLDVAVINAKRNKVLLRAGRDNDLAESSKSRASKVRIQCEATHENSVSPIPVNEKRSILKARCKSGRKRPIVESVTTGSKADGDFGDLPAPNLLDDLLGSWTTAFKSALNFDEGLLSKIKLIADEENLGLKAFKSNKVR